MSATCLALALTVILLAPGTATADAWTTSWDFDAGQTNGWSLYNSQPSYYSAALAEPAGSVPGLGGGLWLYPTGSNAGARLYTAPGNGPATYGGFALLAPGASRVGSFTLNNLAHRDERDRQMIRWSIANDTCFGCEVGYGEYFSTTYLAPTNVSVTTWPATGSHLTLAINSTYCNPATDTTTRQNCPPALARPTNDPNLYAFLYASDIDVTMLDSDQPGLSYSGPLKTLADGGWTNATGAYGLNISASDGSSGVTSLWLIDDADVNESSSFTTCDDTHATYGALECPPTHAASFAANVTALEDGTHTFTVSAYDNADESTDGTIELKIDRTAPDVPAGLQWRERADGARLEWDAVTDADAGVNSYDWEASSDAGASTCAAGSTIELTTPHTGTPCFTAVEGQIDFRVRARDNAGNVGAWSDWTGGVIGPPTISVARAIASNERPLADNEWIRAVLALSADAADAGTDLASVEFELDGQPIASCPILTATPYDCAFNSAARDDGSHVLTVRATDSAEVTPYSTTLTFPLRFDNTAPGAPINPAAETIRSGVRIRWGASDPLGGSPIDRYEYRYLNRSAGMSNWLDTRVLEQVIDTPDIEVNAPSIEARAHDVAGNVSGQAAVDRGELSPPEQTLVDVVSVEQLPATPMSSKLISNEAETAGEVDDDDGADDEYEAELAANTPNRKRGCYDDSDTPYNFGFRRTAAPDSHAGTERNRKGNIVKVWYNFAPYADVPACRATTRQPLDKRKNFTDDGKNYAATNARVPIFQLNNDAIRSGGWPVRDSTGTIRLSVRQLVNHPQLEHPYKWELFNGDPSNGTLLASRNMRAKTPPIKLVGRACVSPVAVQSWPDNRQPSSTDDFLAVQLPSLDSKLSGQSIAEIGRPGLWGIIDRDAIRVGKLDREERRKFNNSVVKGARTGVNGCGAKHPLSAHETKPTVRYELSPVPVKEIGPAVGFPATGTRLDVPAPGKFKQPSGRPDLHHPFTYRKHHRLGGNTWTRCDPLAPNESRNSACGSYAEDLTTPGARIRVLTSSTTGIGGGGLPMAFVPDNATISVIRYVNYCDRNISRADGLIDVPGLAGQHNSNKQSRKLFDSQSRNDLYWNNGGHAFWVYGRVIEPKTPRPVYGWSPEPCDRLHDLRAAWSVARRDLGTKLKPAKKARKQGLEKCNKQKKSRRASCKKKVEKKYKKTVAKKVIKKPPKPKKKKGKK